MPFPQTYLVTLLFACVYLLSVTLGCSAIVDAKILNNRRQVLTKDSQGGVTLWNVLHVSTLLPYMYMPLVIVKLSKGCVAVTRVVTRL